MKALLVFVAVLVILAGVGTLGWYGCELGIHPVREEERWPSGEFPRYRLDQFNLPPPEEVHFESRDGLTLAGWFFRVADGPTVILAHGKDGSRFEMLPHADYLHRGGFSVLMFDSRHRGRSEGHEVTLGAKEPWDIEGAVDYLRKRPDVDPERIGVQGISLGAASGIMAAAETPNIKGVVAESAFKTISSVIDHSFTYVVGPPRFPFALVSKFICELRLGVDLDEVAPVKVIREISPRPVFLIHDREDELLPSDSGKALYKAAREPKVLWQIPEALHGKGWQTAPKEYERRVLAFWRQTFGINRPERTKGSKPKPLGI
ncbi:MAG: alpha/beta hydrolase [Nitrospinota bacterium]